jgi:alkylation response protein AidB-like acyl-CoA dehydrogenase
MTEPDSGSDAFALATSARAEGDAYVLSGCKTFVTNAPIADVFVLFARVGKTQGLFGVTAFLVERSSAGLQVGKPIEKMGLRTSPMAEVVLEGCRVPAGNRLGGEGDGARIFALAMAWERACLLAAAVGAMRRQLDACIAYARTRRQFGSPIAKFQSVANRIVDMQLRLATSRLLLHRVARMSQDDADGLQLEAATAKLHISESWVASCLDAIQIHGGYGYATESEIERELRDAVASRLYSGTSEIQRNIIADALGL